MNDWAEVTANGVWPAHRLCGGVEGANRFGPDAYQVETARKWLRQHAKPRKSINRSRSSYGLKHAAENWGRANSFESYISNGAMIAALLDEGYKCVRTGSGSPNVFANASFPRKPRVLGVEDWEVYA